VVTEFNKNAKRIGVSHTRTYKEEEFKSKKNTKGGGGSGRNTSAAVARVNDKTEKATLGDLDVLSALKAEMESAPAKKEEPKKEEPKEEAPVAEEAPAAEAPAVEEAPSDSKPDDLKKVEGIGPKIASTLAEAGVDTFAKLSQKTPEEISEIISGVRGNHVTTTWPEQAKLASEGKWDELKKWQDELDGGKA